MKNLIIMLIVTSAMAVIVPARGLARDPLPSLETYVDQCVLIVRCKTERQEGKFQFRVLETWKGKYSPDLFYDNPPMGYLYAERTQGNDSPAERREVIFFFTARNQPVFAKGKLVVHSTCFNVNDGKLGYASNTDPGVDPDEYKMDAFKKAITSIVENRTPEFGLCFLQDQPDDRFRDVTLDRVPVKSQTSLWAQSLILFRPECLPFAYQTGKVELVPKARPTDAKIRVFAASGQKERDLLEMTWFHRGVPLRWIMSANVSDVHFSLQPFREGTATEISGQKVAEFVSEVLRLKGEIPGLDRDFKVDLPWPDKLDNGISFSSNSKVNITDVIWWFDRWDVVIKDNTVHILIYSRNPQIAGFDDGSQYFPAEFRKQQLENQRKTP